MFPSLTGVVKSTNFKNIEFGSKLGKLKSGIVSESADFAIFPIKAGCKYSCHNKDGTNFCEMACE